MSTYTQILYQVCFSTKGRKASISETTQHRLYNYIRIVLQNHRCTTYGISGVEDHIHILFSLHPGVSLSEMIKKVKLSSSQFIKNTLHNSRFDGWQKGYAAFTYSIQDKAQLQSYLANQKEHHKKFSFDEEFRVLLSKNDIRLDERYYP